MDDRYLFKAKTAKIVGTYNNDVEDGVWVHGSLRCDVGKYTIFQFETARADYVEYEIDPSTICQYIGKGISTITLFLKMTLWMVLFIRIFLVWIQNMITLQRFVGVMMLPDLEYAHTNTKIRMFVVRQMERLIYWKILIPVNGKLSETYLTIRSC